MSFFNVNHNKSIRYELLEGDSDNPCLIFLHEGLGCVEMWRDFPEQLCQKTNCPGLLYDRCGYGKSSFLDEDRNVHYLHNYALYELPAVIDALLPRKSYILVGHSDGASISLIYGAGKNLLLKGIIAESAHVFVERETIDGIRIADDVYKREGAKGLTKYHGNKTHRIFKAWSDTWLSKWFQHWNIEYLLPSIECPLLVIQGSDDQFGTEKQVTSILSKTSGLAKSYIIEKCGHSPHLEQPDVLLKLMAEFIEELKESI